MAPILENTQKLIKFLDHFVQHRRENGYILFSFDENQDIKSVGEFLISVVCGNINFFLSSEWHASGLRVDYTFVVKCVESEHNDIAIDASDILSTKTATITLFVHNGILFSNGIANRIRPWARQYNKNIGDGPAKLVMCVPPNREDYSDEAEYRKYMNEYIQNKLDGNI